MNKYNFKVIDQEVYFEKLDNGLEVYLIPLNNKTNYTMHYVTKYGSIQTEFIPYNEKKMTKVPDGIAHFLEHKMFEQEDGIDPFTFASKTGTYSNASTNYRCTRYYFEGNNAFKENLDYLLNFVGSPYFTDSNVEKEKGIIAEEIKQYDDNVDWIFDKELKKALLKYDNHRIDIAGTIDTINEITKEDLYKTYYTFYQPSNMFLVVSGKFDVDEAINVIKNNKILDSNKTKFDITIKKINEPLEVYKKESIIPFNIINTKVGYGIKIPIGNKDKIKLSQYLSLMLDIKFGVSSLFREKIKEKKLITSFHTEKEYVDGYFLLLFKATSDKKDELINMIKEELKDIRVTDQEIERMKKVWISTCVMASDDISAYVYNITDDIIRYNKVLYDKIDLFKKLNNKEYVKYLCDIDYTNASVVVVKPKKV